MKIGLAMVLVVASCVACALLLGRPKLPVAAAAALDSRDDGSSGSSLEQQIVAKEKEGLDALKSGHLELFGNLTAEDAVFVDAAGPADKALVMSHVGGFRLTEYAMEDVRFVPVSATAGLISYKITEKGVSHGHEFSAQVYVSSLWAEREHQWVCLFSQETAAKVPPKQPS